MSKYEQRDNSGSLFKNERKEKDTHADYRGECLIDGVAYYMDAWIKKAESGRTWMSFSFKPKEQRQERPQAKPQGKPRRDEFDDVPF